MQFKLILLEIKNAKKNIDKITGGTELLTIIIIDANNIYSNNLFNNINVRVDIRARQRQRQSKEQKTIKILIRLRKGGVYLYTLAGELSPWHTDCTVKVPRKPQWVNYRPNPISLVT